MSGDLERYVGNVAHLRENRDLQSLRELKVPHHSLTSLPSAVSRRSFSQSELVDEYRIAAFQDLNVSDTSVSNVCMDA